MVEQKPFKLLVLGSSPSIPTQRISNIQRRSRKLRLYQIGLAFDSDFSQFTKQGDCMGLLEQGKKFYRRAEHILWYNFSRDVEVAERIVKGKAHLWEYEEFRASELRAAQFQVTAAMLGTADIRNPHVVAFGQETDHLKSLKGPQLLNTIRYRAENRLVECQRLPD